MSPTASRWSQNCFTVILKSIRVSNWSDLGTGAFITFVRSAFGKFSGLPKRLSRSLIMTGTEFGRTAGFYLLQAHLLVGSLAVASTPPRLRICMLRRVFQAANKQRPDFRYPAKLWNMRRHRTTAFLDLSTSDPRFTPARNRLCCCDNFFSLHVPKNHGFRLRSIQTRRQSGAFFNDFGWSTHCDFSPLASNFLWRTLKSTVYGFLPTSICSSNHSYTFCFGWTVEAPPTAPCWSFIALILLTMFAKSLPAVN